MSLLERLKQHEAVEAEEKEAGKSKKDPYWDIKIRLHQKLIEEIEKLPEENKIEATRAEDQEKIRSMINQILERETPAISRMEKVRLAAELYDEVVGLGPITALLRDPQVSEIMVNGADQVYVEKNGRLEKTAIRFRDDEHVLHIIEKIVAPLGRRIDESMPMVDARLPDGSRVNAIIPPVALNGPTITIRKFSQDPFTIEDLIRFGSLSVEMAKFLEACVKARLNIVVSGGTGSGKTTFLNCLSSFIPPDERIITIEDAAELQLRQPHVVSLETRPPNIEGRGAISIRDLVRNSLRMRPNRIIVGEVRGGEALDMLQAMNTGHDGSLTTGHANSPRDMLARLETMVLMAGMDLPVRAIREQIAGAIDLIVQQSRMRDGSRKVTHLTEVLGLEGDTIVTQDIFVYEQEGVDDYGRVKGVHRATGIRPKFSDQLKGAGVVLPENIFSPFMGFGSANPRFGGKNL
ncbi:CpaF family protein [Zhaonella formicivorans]|uniref:CpaF family protein n=1 Tax=Zhaonella formicivorans TaxID=2528593 RepID=UPI0010EB018D|nr:CpaF family protein [Zhaonella formicivorans]